MNKVEVKNEIYKAGSLWIDKYSHIHILTILTENNPWRREAILVNINTGGHGGGRIEVSNYPAEDITDDEWSELTGNNFTRITTPITITPEEG